MHFKKLHLTSALAFAFAMVLLITGCSKDDVVEIVGVCPIVLSTVPEDGDINVPLDQVITVTFNEEVDPETINEQTFTVDGSSSVVGTVTYSGMTASFTPSANLEPNTTYTAIVTTSIKDFLGNALQQNYVWTFTTIPEITLSATPEAGGMLLGAGSFSNGSTVTVAAIPSEGYTFTSWTVDGTVVSTSSSYQFEMDGNIALVANFEEVVLGNFRINLSSSPIAGGTTNGSGQFTENSTATVSALPNPGYVFVNWTEGETIASTSSSYQFVLTGNRTLVANYSQIPGDQFAVVLSANPAAGGSTNGSGSFDAETNITVTATPNTGYAFVNWTANGEEVSTNSSYTFELTANTTLVANFEVRTTYSLNVTAENGTVDENPNKDNYNVGEEIVLTATPADGYEFSSWSGDASGSSNTITVTMNSDKDITANFTLIESSFTLSVTAENGSVEKDPNQETYNDGDQVILEAIPADGYEFSSWSGDASGSANPLTVTMDSDKDITANFTPIESAFTLNVTAQNGNVDVNPEQQTYNYGDQVVLTATPDPNYEFSNWSVDASGSNNQITVVMNSNKNITANFTQIANAGQICPDPAVDLGLAGNYAILAKSGISTTGVTTVTGDMGVSPITSTAITGFGLTRSTDGTYSTSSLVTGRVYASDYTSPTPANLTTAVGNMETAFTTANGIAPDQTELLAGNINGQTLASGVYKWSSGLSVTNSVTLDGGGVDCAKFVFQIAGDLTIANNTKIILINGAKADNIYWVVAGAGAMLGTDVDFSGNILSQTLISVNTRSSVKGRLLAQSAVTLNANAIVKPSN
ncbi:InlB B-repeat-containing protein [Gillisia sp. Q332]|uniref:InlB B-repeat-containing protein n=1 Tax=Gillisia xinjiangensis TaxID=3384765 RepID=UPI00391D4255